MVYGLLVYLYVYAIAWHTASRSLSIFCSSVSFITIVERVKCKSNRNQNFYDGNLNEKHTLQMENFSYSLCSMVNAFRLSYIQYMFKYQILMCNEINVICYLYFLLFLFSYVMCALHIGEGFWWDFEINQIWKYYYRKMQWWKKLMHSIYWIYNNSICSAHTYRSASNTKSMYIFVMIQPWLKWNKSIF